ncbi:hypothetical protein [Flavobacterium cerinum]|uniref:DUF306 domain-containing protein n=1 Tax=Flavobacterium cerinum TaxID=2502784 RepID=A0A3S3QTJ4_9FLAO|nr:hypothetical protein [Flavobacterium cerinum]RWX02420.1 hypothetical protein EPI11_04150 [Flavobacterium cerinum]
MKKSLFLFIIFFTTSVIFAQDGLVGKWKTNIQFGLGEAEEYVLSKSVSNNFLNSWLELKPKSAFVSYRSQGGPCGNNCYTTIYGRYSIEDEKYINFHIDTITYSRSCPKREDSFPNITLSEYVIEKTAEGYNFVRNDVFFGTVTKESD